MTCPCKDMKTLQYQLLLSDFGRLLNGNWAAQTLHGLRIFQGIKMESVWIRP